MLSICNRWFWQWRLARCERLIARQEAGAVYVTSWEQRLIEKLHPVELKDAREAQSLRRARKDAIYSLDLEIKRLRSLLFPLDSSRDTAELPKNFPDGVL